MLKTERHQEKKSNLFHSLLQLFPLAPTQHIATNSCNSDVIIAIDMKTEEKEEK